MKIAHITWSMGTGGIETMLVDIVNEQIKNDEVRVFVINEYYDKDLLCRIDKNVKVSLLNRKARSKNIWPIIRLNIMLLSFHPDVIHCHQGHLAPIIKVPFKKVLTIHNTHSKADYWKKFDKLFCISKAVKEYTVQLGYTNGIVVYNGIHTEEIARKDYSQTSENTIKRIVCIGRLNKDKGQRILIDAAKELVNNRQQTSFSIDLIGDGMEHERLKKLVVDYGLSNYVRFLGKQPRNWFYPKLKNYDLFVMPSISEGFGLTLAEACAAKLPVLTCDLAGPMEVIGNGKFGVSFKTGDVLALADGIEHFLRNGYDLTLTEKAYYYVKNNFDVKATANRYIEEYKN